MADFWQVFLLQNYNTRLVVIAVAVLGAVAGAVGVFLLAGKRSLLGDTFAHATLSGLVLAFMLASAFSFNERSYPLLFIGALLSGLAAIFLVAKTQRASKLKNDAALAIWLSVFFGLGVVLLSVAQQYSLTSPAGINHFIYGKTASLLRVDLLMITTVALLAPLVLALFFKEFCLVSFDSQLAQHLGFSPKLIDGVQIAIMALVMIVGMPAVGLVLIIAFLLIPASAAKFWSQKFSAMIFIAAILGALSGYFGAVVSAVWANFPAGASIVLVASGFFLLSFIFGKNNGLLQKILLQGKLRRKSGRQHLLRAVYEILENQQKQDDNFDGIVANTAINLRELQRHRSWHKAELAKLLRQAQREDHLEKHNSEVIALSESGFGEAARITRNHRLWEHYLISYAAIAPSHVDRDADMVEHVLGRRTVRELEKQMRSAGKITITSPHKI